MNPPPPPTNWTFSVKRDTYFNVCLGKIFLLKTGKVGVIIIPIPEICKIGPGCCHLCQLIIIAAFIMHTYPSSEDVQGATYYYYPGRWIQFQDRTYSAQFPLPRKHSLPSCLSWRYRQIHCIHNIFFTSYRVPIYTPGWRAAMWIKAPLHKICV